MAKQELAVPNKLVKITSPKEIINFASTLKKVIVEQKLFSTIKGRNYVNVEGWQFAGLITGIIPIVKVVEMKQGEEGEIKYRAEVELSRVNTGKVVGYGVAYCSNKETSKKDADEYVIASMAQTRATGKAYRNIFSWLMKIAGYETTPAEEMVNGDSKTSPIIEGGEGPATEEQKDTIKKLVGNDPVLRNLKVRDDITKQEAADRIAELVKGKK